jgi:hypothetical protein
MPPRAKAKKDNDDPHEGGRTWSSVRIPTILHQYELR